MPGKAKLNVSGSSAVPPLIAAAWLRCDLKNGVSNPAARQILSTKASDSDGGDGFRHRSNGQTGRNRITSGLPDNSPGTSFYASQNYVSASIVTESRSSRKEIGMRFQRRKLLRTLSFAFGSNFIWRRSQLGIGAQTAIQPKVSPPPAGAAVVMGSPEERVEKSPESEDSSFEQRSESAGALVPATPGDFDDTNDRRGNRVAASGRTNRFHSF
jgi:hypothetical protein